MKNKILSMFLFLSLTEGCKKTDGVTTPPVTIKPVINAIQPITGGYGTIDTLIGTNFLLKDSVKFNGVSAVVKYSSTDTIIAIVPKGAGTGAVSIVVNGDTVVGPVFKYIYTANVTTFVGNGQRSGKIDGQGANASFISPYTIIADKAGNLYVTDEGLMEMKT